MENKCSLSISLCFQVVAKKYRNFDIPKGMAGIWRYLTNAYSRDEFTNTWDGTERTEELRGTGYIPVHSHIFHLLQTEFLEVGTVAFTNSPKPGAVTGTE